jgi:hypothetical protein
LRHASAHLIQAGSVSGATYEREIIRRHGIVELARNRVSGIDLGFDHHQRHLRISPLIVVGRLTSPKQLPLGNDISCFQPESQGKRESAFGVIQATQGDISMAVQPKPFDANAEAAKCYDLSKGDPKAFQHELDLLRQNPAQFNATVKAMEAKEASREATYGKTDTGKLHELKIVHSSPGGPVSKIYAQDVSKENDVEKAPLPPVTLYDASAADTAQYGAGKGAESPAAAAARAEHGRQDAARKEAARINTEATTLMTELKNHDDKGFSADYSKLSDADKAAVGKQMQQMRTMDDPTLHINSNADGTIKSVDRAGKLEYINPAEFLNETFEKNRSVALKDYVANLSPADRAEFIAKLQAEQGKHDLTVDVDDKGNIVVKTLNGKKQWDSKPENGFGKILHQGEGVVVRPHY